MRTALSQRRHWLLLVALAVTGSASLAWGQPQQAAELERLFARHVGPLLVEKCGGCHGEAAQEIKGELDLRTRAGLLRGGESGQPAVIPGNPDESLLMVSVRWQDGFEMPPKENDRLTKQQIQWLHDWIAGGALWPDRQRQRQLLDHDDLDHDDEDWSASAAGGQLAVATSGGLNQQWDQRLYNPADLWAYQPVRSPDVPWRHAGSSDNPVDAFLNRRLEKAGLKPVGRADKLTLIRRATYDLTGLPPTPAEVEAFLSDTSGAAFARLVDRLLDSPRYGEQWGRHWLDVVRYADSSGFSNDYVRPNAWRYRDYVIRALNDDKPYDQFIREQIAGDEIDPSNPEHLIAVGFLRMGPWEHTGMSVAAVTRQQYLDDITNNVGVAFLGQELRCAKCHDHKFDPIPTRDYYRMQAIFAPLQFADRQVPLLPEENTSAFGEGKKRIKKLIAAGGVKGLESIPREERPPVQLDEESQVKGHAKVNRKRKDNLQRELLRFEPLAFSVYSGPSRTVTSNQRLHRMPARRKMRGKPDTVQILHGGALESPGDEVDPGVLSVVYGLQQQSDPARRSSLTEGLHGRRTELANWIASADNPLTARVMVNRIWLYHFGQALAGNPNNFGQTGKKPTHPELLDFLARYFIEHGWSLKEMHRLIMLSDAYQRSSEHSQFTDLRQADPGNELLAVFSPRRLTAEELRDSMLLVSGELNLEMGGIPARPEINLEVAMQPRHIMGSVGPAYQPNRTPSERNRRTIYAERIRTLRDPMLEVFNQPGLDVSCEVRDVASTTPQVFALFNSQNSHDRALAMADRLQRQSRNLADQIRWAFRLAFGRSPADDELAGCKQHYQKMLAHHQQHQPVEDQPPRYVIREMVEEMTGLKFYWVEDLDLYRNYVPDLKPWNVNAQTRALSDLCLVLLNSNEFMYVY